MSKPTQDPHVRAMRQVSAAQQINNEQIHSLTTNVDKLTEKLDGFVTAVALISQLVQAHDAAIEKINQREEDRQKIAAANRFALGNNAIFWLLSGGAALAALVQIFAQHWK